MKESTTYHWILRLLSWFCPAHLCEEIEGDLIQHYERDLKKFSEQKSKRRLVWNTIRFFRPGILLRNKKSRIKLTSINMLINYFTVAWRVMLRNKAFTFINIFGLALGITGSLLLFLWIKQELNYEQFHADNDRIFVAWNRSLGNNQIDCWETTPRVLSPTLKEEYASVESAVSYAKWDAVHLFTVGETKLLKTTGVFTDSSFLTMLSFPLLKGDPRKAMSEPSSLIITDRFAKQLFGDEEAFGKSVTISQEGYSFEFTVTGVLKDLPSNTDFNFEYIIPFTFLESLGEKDTFWGNNSVTTYVKLKTGTSEASFNEAVKDIVKNHFDKGQDIEIFLYPLTKMRLYSRFENGVAVGGRIEVIRMLGLLAICLTVIACINFINLSTARAQRRAKEVAVRKVTGAHRISLVFQFLCESILVVLGAGILSLLFAYMALPFFNTLIGQQLFIDFTNTTFLLSAFAFILLIGVLAGGYPALYLSAFHPVKILKGLSSYHSKSALRTFLVVIQFGVAITLIVSVIVVRKQIEFVQNRNAGYSKDNLIYVPLTGDLFKNYSAYKNEILQAELATSITRTSARMTEQWSSTGGIGWNGKDPSNKTDFERFYMDDKLSTTAGLTLVHGRDIDLIKFPSDSTAVLLNQTALDVMGFENPIGEILSDDKREYHVVGVVEDFILTSPFQKVEPILLFCGSKLRNAFNVAYLKLNTDNSTSDNLHKLSELTTKYNPEYPFEYHFADAEYERKFSNLKTTLTTTTIFTSIAICIACLGLLGLSTYMTEARVKEIGIRKVMGGTVLGITKLLSLNSLKPIVIAVIIFTPVAWYSIDWWLQSFAYRISIDVWIFIYAAIALLSIALLTIATQTIRAATANPVDSLRNE